MGASPEFDLPSMILRLFLALLLSSVFGWERERRRRPAGLRTHMLVCVGSALITMVSESYAMPGGYWKNTDPARISAQIVSGIGFIGAGTIMVRGNAVRGLTTAATLWVSAALGIAVGHGGEFIYLAAATSLIVLFILTVIDRWENRFLQKFIQRELTVSYVVGEGSVAEIASALRAIGIEMRSAERLQESSAGIHRVLFEVWTRDASQREQASSRLLDLPWVKRTEWDA